MKNLKIIFCISLLLILCTNCIVSLADGFSTGDFHPDTKGSTQFVNNANNILGYIQAVGIFISVGAVIVLGIKFVTASPEGKAQIKDHILPLVIGIIIILGITTLLEPIYTLLENSGFTGQ